MKLKWVLVSIVVLALGVLAWHWDFSEPVVKWDPPPALGRAFELSFDVTDEGRGIRSVRVWLRQGENSFQIFSEDHETAPPWEKGPQAETIAVSAKDLGEQVRLAEGDLDIVIEVTDQPNLWLFSRKVVDVHATVYDATPPRVEVVSSQHYLRQGGSEAVLYRLAEKGARSGVQVGDKRFLGYSVGGGESDLHLCIFALAYDQPADTPVHVWAEDLAANRSEGRFYYKTFPQTFRSSRINLTDGLIDAVSRDILANTTEVTEKATPIETFIEINSRYRVITNQKLLEVTASPTDRLLWRQPFLQLTNSQVEARFADHRVYYYEGKEVDRQTHLGFDLASLAQSPVEASNDGIVVFADYLGIYGNTVILDHGLGLFSLYGHLSAFDVIQGQAVARGDTLGRTGQSGLAAGDHLHFSMMVGGVQVTPLEWWDPKWVQDHVLSKWSGAGSETK